MSVQQISVFLENKSGAFADLTKILSGNKINLRAVSLAETSEFGIVRMIVDDVFSAATILKDSGYIARLTPVVGVDIADNPGSLEKVIEVLNSVGIDVDYLYAFLDVKEGRAHIIIKVCDNAKAEAALRSAGFKLLEQD